MMLWYIMTLWWTHVYILPSNYFQEKQVERWMRRPGYYNNFPHTSITRPTSNFSLHDCRLKYRKKFFFRPPMVFLFLSRLATQANSVSGFKAGGVVKKNPKRRHFQNRTYWGKRLWDHPVPNWKRNWSKFAQSRRNTMNGANAGVTDLSV